MSEGYFDGCKPLSSEADYYPSTTQEVNFLFNRRSELSESYPPVHDTLSPLVLFHLAFYFIHLSYLFIYLAVSGSSLQRVGFSLVVVRRLGSCGAQA